MNDDVLEPKRVPTGIPGLDTILEGGPLSGGVYIVEGPPGAGKTTLGCQFAFSHAKAGGKAVYVTLLAESYTRLLVHLRRMQFFDPSLIPSRITFLSAFKILEADGLDSLLTSIRRTVMEHGASALVVDGLVSAEEASRSAKDFKKFIHELQTVMGMTGCTALLLNSTERPSGFRPELTMVDGVIELSDSLRGLKSVRSLVVRKMRGTAQLRGSHSVDISNAGIRVVPRLESMVGRSKEQVDAPSGRAAFGVQGLDAMLHGGVPHATMSVIAGPPGSGKSTLGLQFVSAGIARGEPAVFLGLYDSEFVTRKRSERLGMHLQHAESRKLLTILEQQPVEGSVDLFVDRLLTAVRSTGARRLCIDGSQGFEIAADTPHRLREVFCALDTELAALGVTTVYTMETQPLFDTMFNLASTGMSASTQNIILLGYEAGAGRITRKLAVLKVRDSAHDSCISEFEITDRGIVVRAGNADVGRSPA